MAPPGPDEGATTGGLSRRGILKFAAATGIGNAVFGRALAALGEAQSAVTAAMIEQAAWVAGLELSAAEREQMVAGINSLVEDFATNRQVVLDNAVAPALIFRTLVLQSTASQSTAPQNPASLQASRTTERRTLGTTETATPKRPRADLDLAFAPVSQLSGLLRSRQISSLELTRLYLERLERFDPQLHCVVSLTADLALEQAARADREIAAGRYRGPLHGVPWGAKDLFAVPGYRTTWGAQPFAQQQRDETATVVTRLEEAGAVLVAKLTLGALAMGDVWFGGRTNNPWNLEQGSSGSSAGSAAAVSAGLAGFALGTETLGSIVSPCTRCGATGLRPTFGRVSRHGAMALAWSMDKVGPIARSVEDCALVFHAIEGADGLDPSAVDGPFDWPYGRDIRTLRVGYLAALFEEDRSAGAESEEAKARQRVWQAHERRTLQVLRDDLGLRLIPIKLPDRFPIVSLRNLLFVEAACAFDALTRSGEDDLLVAQEEGAWPNFFRQAQLIPAVEYLRANRIRSLVMRDMEAALDDIDVYVAPSFGGTNLLLTNLTGHPAVVLPNGFRPDGTPTSITFNGRLNGESALLAVAHAYQQATDFHLQRPPGIVGTL